MYLIQIHAKSSKLYVTSIKYCFFLLFRSQGITDPRMLACAKTWANARKRHGEKTISSHIQEFSGIPDMDFDGKQSQTAIGKNYALEN